MWRTVGFLASFATLLCLGGLVTFVVIMCGGKYKRETGWPFAAGMLTLISVMEFVAISIVVSWSATKEFGYKLIYARRTFMIMMISLIFPGGRSIRRSTSAPLRQLSVF